MKKAVWDYLILLFQMIFVGIFVLYVFSCYVDANNENFLDRSMYTENVAGIQLSNSYLESTGEIVELDVNDISVDGSYAVYKYISYEGDEIVRGIYETDDLFGLADYIETGRFFASEDFSSKTKTAVIGSEILSLTYEIDGKNYYGYNGSLYEVIGVFEETGSDLDDIVYLNLTALLDERENDMGLYYVDSNRTQTVENVISSMEANAEGDYQTSRVEYESPLIKTGMHKTTGLFVYSATIASVIYMFITLLYFVTGKEYTVAIQKLCGMTKRDLLFEYGLKISATIVAAYAIICVLEKLVADRFMFFATDYLGWQHFVLLALAMIIIDIGAVVGVVSLAQRVDISDTLKGR